MVEANADALIDEVVRRIRTVSDPERVVLFGSYARNESQTSSDLDLLVIVEQVDSTRAEEARI